MSRQLRNEDGFTLTELLVVIMLLGMVVAGAYSVIRVAYAGAEIQRRDSYVSTAISQPIQVMDVVLSQNVAVETGSGDYLISCLTDQDANNAFERHVFQATADGRLTETVYSVASNGTNLALLRSTVWQAASTNPPARNINVAAGVPLFSYGKRDANGAWTPTTPAEATECVVRIQARYGSKDFTDQRRVLFRNDR